MDERQVLIKDALHQDMPSMEWFDEESTALMQANDELAQARNVAIDLLASIEDIMLHQNPQIAAEWQVTIGVWENRLLEAQIAARKAKRRCNLAQTSINDGEEIDAQAIEAQLDAEFEQWQQQLEDATVLYQQAVATQITAVQISASDFTELKKVFRTLAKRLHPDLHPGLDEAARNMFTLAELAYRKGDLKILRSLEVSTRGLEEGPEFCATVIEAQAELALVETQISELKRSEDNLKSDKPYCLKALLDDEQWVAGRVEQIQEEIDRCQAVEQEYLARYKELADVNE